MTQVRRRNEFLRYGLYMPQGSRITAKQHELTRLSLDVLKESQGKMSNVQFAKLSEISRPMLVDFMSGKKVPTVNEFVRLCLALDLRPSDVVREAERRRGGGQVLAFPGKPGLSPSGSTVESPEQVERAALGHDVEAEIEAQQDQP